MKGNMPHPQIVIKGATVQDSTMRLYHVVGKNKLQLQKHIYKKVTTTGIIRRTMLRFAGKSNRGIMRYTIMVESYLVIK